MQGGCLLQQCHQRCSSSFHSSRLLESHPADHRPACRAADCFFLRFFFAIEKNHSPRNPMALFFFFFAARDAHAMWVWDPQFTASGLCKYCSHSRHGCEQRRKEVSAIGVTSLLPRATRGSKSVCSWWVDVLSVANWS